MNTHAGLQIGLAAGGWQSDQPLVVLDPSLPTNPKLREAISRGGPAAFTLYVQGLCSAVAELSDGHISHARATELVRDHHDGELFMLADEPEHIIDALLSAGLWHRTEDGYVIHDFADYQYTKSQAWQLFHRHHRKRGRDRLRRARANAETARAESGKVRAHTDNVVPGFVDLSTATQDSAALPGKINEQTPGERETAPFVRLAEHVDNVNERTIPAWLGAATGLPADWAAARALESLKRRRAAGPLRNEAGYVTAVLKQLRQERTA